MLKHDATLSARVQNQFAEQFNKYGINVRELPELEEIRLEFCAIVNHKGKNHKLTDVLSISSNEYHRGVPAYFIDHWNVYKSGRKISDKLDTLILFKNVESILEYIELNYISEIQTFCGDI